MKRAGKIWLTVIISAVVLSFGGICLFRGIRDNKNRSSFNTNTIGENVNSQGNKNDKPDYSSFAGLDMNKDDIRFSYEGKDLALTLPVYVEKDRYYVPATEIMDKIGGRVEQDNGSINITADGRTINIDTSGNTMTAGDRTYKLKEKVIISGNVVYLSLLDLTRGFDLKTDWNLDQKVISLFKNRDNLVKAPGLGSGKPAMIRLEDIVAARGGVEHYVDNETLQKLRIVVDYIYSKDIPFHVAWVPRFIDPRESSKQDNDLANNYNMYNADFVFTLDYMMDRDGIIGLHGYTHQYGKTISIGGTEFGGPSTSSDKYADERLNMAIESAKKLDIPYGFFESPHYEAASNQFKVMEKYFDVIYQHYPGVYGSKVVEKKNGDRTIKYVPAPLDYLSGKGDVPNMIKKIKNTGSKGLAGFFYHPWLEFEDIKIDRDASGYPAYTYDDSSILHQLFNEFEKDGYKFTTIKDVQ
jgi:Copper amine oxidase N-terminal domain./Uncharacterized protein conserved in bacteria (DUF2334).